MSDERPRRSFGDIYREQYRQVSSSKISRASRIIFPVGLVVAVIFGRRLPEVIWTVVLASGAGGFVAAVLLSHWQRRRATRSGAEVPQESDGTANDDEPVA